MNKHKENNKQINTKKTQHKKTIQIYAQINKIKTQNKGGS
jgi:hypothetical protein